MVPAEAGVAEVWNYLTLVLLPDVALWRWPNPNCDPRYERLLGKPRNVFRRHWWRAHLLGPELTMRMREDELVQIVERTATLGGDPRVARAVAAAFLHAVDTQSIEVGGAPTTLKRMQIMRALAKRVLRMARVVALSTLNDEELAALMAELAELTLAAAADAVDGTVVPS
ncbi:hypothetical protein L615_006600000150 [Nocardioides sp. J9]|nr:hypothetical protein L615_006600000150 [Nocardioides sp. J9]